MVISDDLLFSTVAKWAAGVAEGYVDGRLPLEDQISTLDYVSKLQWKTPIGVPPPPMPKLKFHEAPPVALPKQYQATAGPLHRAWSLPIPDALARFLGIPVFSKFAHETAKDVKDISPSFPVKIGKIPTCTDKGIFKQLPDGERPPHPEIKFGLPMNRVHVNLYNPSTQKSYWDASFDLKGKSVLSNSMEPVLSESAIPEFVPPCVVKKTNLELRIDAEVPGMSTLTVQYLNPSPGEQNADTGVKPFVPIARPPGTEHPQQELNSADGILCNKVEQLQRKEVITENVAVVSKPKSEVFLPGPFAREIWNLDRSREEANGLNPGGLPMMDIAPKDLNTVGENSSGFTSRMSEASSMNNGEQPVFLLPRRADFADPTEIKVDQLSNLFSKQPSSPSMSVFDARNPPKSVYQVDKTASLFTPPGFHQPTISKTLYSPAWQGVHDSPKTGEAPPGLLHPSIVLKHPANYAHVTLVDKLGDGCAGMPHPRVVWDAVFKVDGGHKIAADQKPVGGTIKDFPNFDISPGKNKLFSLKVDVDNPFFAPPKNIDSKNTNDKLIEIWRQSDFLFNVSRPAAKANALVQVTPSNMFGKIDSAPSGFWKAPLGML